MGMAKALTPEEQKEFEKDIKKMELFEKFVHHCTDFCLGFFVYPFLHFIICTTAVVAKNPSSLSDGEIILYISLITGIFYLLKQQTIIIIETKRINFLFITLGLLVFIKIFL